jgi:YidC/Oxa1 family membrane protein insertase
MSAVALVGVVWWQALLNGLGAILAFFYSLVPNYGVAIILLTVAIRVVLLPLGIKQIRSMQAMQAIQPKVKELQRKYKGDRQKQNEETMKLYKEYGVNPFSGCLPLFAQFPVLIALFAVLRVPGGIVHIPNDSRLHTAIVNNDTHFLGSNLLCSAGQAGKVITVTTKPGDPAAEPKSLDCGHGIPVRIPYYFFALAMVGTTYYQQRQMQKASPPGANPQQQALTKVMPLLFGVWGFLFPAGLVIYWTTTNAIQIGQQAYLIRRGHIGPGALEAKAETIAGRSSAKAKAVPDAATKGGKRPTGTAMGRNRRPGSPASGSSQRTGGGSGAGRSGSAEASRSGDGSKAGTSKQGSSGSSGKSSGSGSGSGRSATGGSASRPGGPSRPKPAGGGTDGGDRKKRRKR